MSLLITKLYRLRDTFIHYVFEKKKQTKERTPVDSNQLNHEITHTYFLHDFTNFRKRTKTNQTHSNTVAVEICVAKRSFINNNKKKNKLIKTRTTDGYL